MEIRLRDDRLDHPDTPARHHLLAPPPASRYEAAVLDGANARQRFWRITFPPGLIVADSTLAVPFAVLIFTAFMSGIPGELLQAAKTDGAGTWRTFRSIVLPMSRNSIVTVSLFAFLWSWSDFVFAGTLVNGGAHEPITLGIYHYIGNNNQGGTPSWPPPSWPCCPPRSSSSSPSAMSPPA